MTTTVVRAERATGVGRMTTTVVRAERATTLAEREHPVTRKRLTAFGNSYGIVIDKPILELLGITPETEFELSTADGGAWFCNPNTAPSELDWLMPTLAPFATIARHLGSSPSERQ